MGETRKAQGGVREGNGGEGTYIRAAEICTTSNPTVTTCPALRRSLLLCAGNGLTWHWFTCPFHAANTAPYHLSGLECCVTAHASNYCLISASSLSCSASAASPLLCFPSFLCSLCPVPSYPSQLDVHAALALHEQGRHPDRVQVQCRSRRHCHLGCLGEAKRCAAAQLYCIDGQKLRFHGEYVRGRPCTPCKKTWHY